MTARMIATPRPRVTTGRASAPTHLLEAVPEFVTLMAPVLRDLPRISYSSSARHVGGRCARLATASIRRCSSARPRHLGTLVTMPRRPHRRCLLGGRPTSTCTACRSTTRFSRRARRAADGSASGARGAHAHPSPRTVLSLSFTRPSSGATSTCIPAANTFYGNGRVLLGSRPDCSPRSCRARYMPVFPHDVTLTPRPCKNRPPPSTRRRISAAETLVCRRRVRSHPDPRGAPVPHGMVLRTTGRRSIGSQPTDGRADYGASGTSAETATSAAVSSGDRPAILGHRALNGRWHPAPTCSYPCPCQRALPAGDERLRPRWGVAVCVTRPASAAAARRRAVPGATPSLNGAAMSRTVVDAVLDSEPRGGSRRAEVARLACRSRPASSPTLTTPACGRVSTVGHAAHVGGEEALVADLEFEVTSSPRHGVCPASRSRRLSGVDVAADRRAPQPGARPDRLPRAAGCRWTVGFRAGSWRRVEV